jgi:hypothetical protein
MATALPTLSEFSAQLPQPEEIPIALGDTSVIHAALIVRAKISLVVNGTKNPQLSDASTIGANVQSFLKLKEWCEKNGITMPATDITEIIGGFKVNIQISLDSAVIPFQVDLPYIHAESQKTASFTVLVCTLASKPIDETSIIIEAFKLQKHGLAALVNADAAITLSPKFDPAVAAYDPFSRMVISPFPITSVVPSPVSFLNAVKTNPGPVPPTTELTQEQQNVENDKNFTTVSYQKKRVVYGTADRPRSLDGTVVYNPATSVEQTRIWAWRLFKDNGLKRDKKVPDIFGQWIAFVLKNHDEFKDKNFTNFDTYLREQLGDDFEALRKLVPN